VTAINRIFSPKQIQTNCVGRECWAIENGPPPPKHKLPSIKATQSTPTQWLKDADQTIQYFEQGTSRLAETQNIQLLVVASYAKEPKIFQSKHYVLFN